MEGEALKEIKFTYKDYLYLPDDGKRYQIIEGEVHMVPAPVPYHQEILFRLAQLVRNFVEEKGLGKLFIAPCDVVLSREDVIQPDIFFIRKERSDIIGEKNIRGAPDLIIEITSSYTEKLDRILKKALYERYKVGEYWIIDPARKKAEIFTLSGNIYESLGIYKEKGIIKSRLIEGLEIDLKRHILLE